MPIGLTLTGDSTRVQGSRFSPSAGVKVRVSIPRSPYSGLENL